MNLHHHVATLLLAAVVASGAWGRDATSFAGKWTGPWTNTLDERGTSSLKLSEDGDGALTGIWDGISVTGERINKNTIELKGKNRTRSYQLTGTIRGGKMTLKYVVTRLNSDGSYEGTATLTRVEASSDSDSDSGASRPSRSSRPFRGTRPAPREDR